MLSTIVVTNHFDGSWPFAADHFHELWLAQGPVEFIRLQHGDQRGLTQVLSAPDQVERLASLGLKIELDGLNNLVSLKELAVSRRPPIPQDTLNEAMRRGIRVYRQPGEGCWRESVAECAIALTICGLRRIPQLHQQMQSDMSVWKYRPEPGTAKPGGRGAQFCDDHRFANGTVAGKRIRVVGAGNISSHYAKVMTTLGADVAAYDPFASDPCFHLAGTRKEWHLERLVKDADIFAPMVPLLESTRGMLSAKLIDLLPKGCLVVLVTRARVCDMEAIRRRVLADEIALAADVFDVEPLPLDDPLLGRHNVIHTPHVAGRTIEANKRYAKMLAEQFLPVE